MSKSIPCETASVDIIVLGGGPAGAASALGLHRLGYEVALVTTTRPFSALEGISQRVIEGLKAAGIGDALVDLPPASPRRVTWNGSTSAANQETLVNRLRFDLSLRDRLQRAGVQLFEARVDRVTETTAGWRLTLSDGKAGRTLSGRFLVEARGRSAPAIGIPRIKGPDTLSLLHYWQGPELQPFSAVESFQDGWAWMAAGADGRRYLQLTLDARSTDLPAKSDLPGYCEARFRQLQQAAPFLAGARPSAQVHARTSASVLHRQVVGARWLRVGDAAMAVDPLSGNGIFQALSSALIAPAVIHTLLQHPEDADAAKAFYQARIDHLFYRFARIGRDFYRMETRWSDCPFWQARRDWPDRQATHQPVTPGSWHIEQRPVVDNNRIRSAEVLITPDQPLGIWHLQGIELAPVMRLLRASPNLDEPASLLQNRLGIPLASAEQVWRWVRAQQLL